MRLAERTALVTGGAGFIGSHLAETLLERGADVVIADDLSRGRLENIDHLLDEVDFRPVDLTRPDGCQRAMEGVDDVFHLAASVGGIHYINREHVGGLTPSVLMNQHLLEAARVHDVDRFLFTSSACIYSPEHEGLNEFSETQAYPADPETTYGWAKILGEIACQAYQADYGIETSVVRIFNAYGPRENLDPGSSHVIPSLCRKAVEAPEQGAIEIFGDGTQQRGFVFIDDLVEGLLRSIQHKTDGEPINLGNASEVVTINELARKILDISGKDLSLEHDLSQPTGTDNYCADTTRMERALEWEPTVALDDGLERTYSWVQDELERGQPVVAETGETP